MIKSYIKLLIFECYIFHVFRKRLVCKRGPESARGNLLPMQSNDQGSRKSSRVQFYMKHRQKITGMTDGFDKYAKKCFPKSLSKYGQMQRLVFQRGPESARGMNTSIIILKCCTNVQGSKTIVPRWRTISPYRTIARRDTKVIHHKS